MPGCGSGLCNKGPYCSEVGVGPWGYGAPGVFGAPVRAAWNASFQPWGFPGPLGAPALGLGLWGAAPINNVLSTPLATAAPFTAQAAMDLQTRGQIAQFMRGLNQSGFVLAGPNTRRLW